MNKNKFARSHQHRAQHGIASLFIAFILTVVVSPAYGQTSDEDKLMAVMSIINMLLLDRDPPIPQPEGEGVVLGIDELSPDSYQVTENLYAEFKLQRVGTELCFIVDSTEDINPGDLTVEVNGEPQEAQLGENCFRLSLNEQRSVNYINLIINAPGLTVTVSTIELQSTNQTQLLLPRLTRGEWDEKAVRKVLKVFAHGGHATDQQIYLWSVMQPAAAITEMLNFNQNNPLLSPLAPNEVYVDTATPNQFGKLRSFAGLLSDESANTPIPIDDRDNFELRNDNLDGIFTRMATVRGLNPFRQKIGLWETNYHLAVNLEVLRNREQMTEFYDLVMEAHAAGLPYKDVMGIAAKSSAVAIQYGHMFNSWNSATNECECNDDFAREVHQLYYGIFGENDPNHEDVTIPETAKLLTGMNLPYIHDFGFALEIDFQTDDHHVDPVSIFGQQVAGADANAKIDALMPLSMQHPESLKNLPIMIISVLADDNLDEQTKNLLRASWASMGINRVLLDFIQAYAISTLFHSPKQRKYLTSLDKAIYLANKNNLSNLEAFIGGGHRYSRRPGRIINPLIEDDFAGEIFRPLHNVFGGQTSLEASDSSLVFENNYNRLTDDERRMREAVYCESCDIGDSDTSWEKDWPSVLPQREDGNYYVEDVAAWLWNHAVGSMDNYTELEKAHLYSLLGAARIQPGGNDDGNSGFDFNLVMCVIADYRYSESATDSPILEILEGGTWNDYCRYYDDGGNYLSHELAALNAVMTGDQILNDPTAQNVLSQLGQVTLPLNTTEGINSGLNQRIHARERINSALGFIYTTPFVFAEGE